MGVVYGDLLMRVLHRVRPYEIIPGSADVLYHRWMDRCRVNLATGQSEEFKENIWEIVRDFDQLEIARGTKPRVGVVGEILVKYHPAANNNIVRTAGKRGSGGGAPGSVRLLPVRAPIFEFLNHQVHGKRSRADAVAAD